MRQAFSLVELSIVLVILGLLTGGILTGQNLIRAAELRSVTTDFNKYQTAVMTFRDKYFYLPGDMPNATQFWGAAHATPSTCITTQSTGLPTCNGNGDGQVANLSSTTGDYEQFRFWQHLANAGLVEGRFSGVSGAGGSSHHVNGTNAPLSKISNAGFGAVTAPTETTSGAHRFAGNYGLTFYFGGQHNTTIQTGGILLPEEMWNIDSKMDDGMPGTGKIRSAKNAFRSCASSNDANTATYMLDLQAKNCFVIFIAF